MFLNNSQNSQGSTYIGVTFSRTLCFTEHLQWRLLLKVTGFLPVTSLWRDYGKNVFLWILQNFKGHLYFWQNTSGWLLLVFICEFWVFQNTSFIQHLRKTAISCTSWRISTTRYSKNYLTGPFKCFISKREVAIWRRLFT